MEGIITGIGDKELGKNIIKPEYDAIINDFIIGKNTILEGLVLNGNNLSAGTCILCGYRGTIEESQNIGDSLYVYGKFTLNFNKEKEDSFEIVNTVPSGASIDTRQISGAGVYYLALYARVFNVDTQQYNIAYKLDHYNENGEWKSNGNYPLNSYYSVETENVLDYAVISETATTPTETKTITNELGEEETVIATDLHLTQPNRVANTEYVHAQIDREVDYTEIAGDLYSKDNLLIGTYKAKRKSKYVILDMVITSYGGEIKNFLPSDFIPTSIIYFAIPQENGFVMHSINTLGELSLIGGLAGSPDLVTRDKYVSIGYQCL